MEWYAGKDLKRKRVKSIVDSFVYLDLRENLYRITSEVVVIVGGLDHYHFRPGRMMLHAIENCRLVYIPYAHHETNHAAPSKISHQIKRFRND